MKLLTSPFEYYLQTKDKLTIIYRSNGTIVQCATGTLPFFSKTFSNVEYIIKYKKISEQEAFHILNINFKHGFSMFLNYTFRNKTDLNTPQLHWL